MGGPDLIRIQLHREKCIGCNYCVEVCPQRWQMSKRDGKCILIGSRIKGPFHQLLVGDHEKEPNLRAAEICPVDIIRVS